jgi:ATP synthase F1 delta subunit
VREALRGYAAAVLEPLASEAVSTLADELARFDAAVNGSHDLVQVLTDDALATDLRAGVVADLLAAASPETRRLADFAVRSDDPGELPVDLAYLASRAAEEPALRTGAPALDPGAGHTAVNERLEGYAVALLEGADGQSVDAVEDELFRFTRTLAGSPELAATLGNVDLPLSLRTGVVTDLLEGRADPATARIVCYAVREARSQLGRHLDWLVDRVGEERGRRNASVTAAVELSAEQRDELVASLSRLTGRRVSIQVDVDAELLGGLRVVVGDTVIDGTIRRRLNQVRSALAGGPSSQRERPA